MAKSIDGRFGFCYSQFLGRAMVAPLGVLRQRANSNSKVRAIDAKLRTALLELADAVANTPPRTLRFWSEEAPTLLFTDGAVENNDTEATVGGVIISPRCKGARYFGVRVPQAMLDKWQAGGLTHVVAQAELLPIILARLTWVELLRGAWVISFVDNEGVKAALVNGNTRALESVELLSLAARLEMRSGSYYWYTRVPSPSNIADGPSRLDFEFISSFSNSVRDVPIWPE